MVWKKWDCLWVMPAGRVLVTPPFPTLLPVGEGKSLSSSPIFVSASNNAPAKKCVANKQIEEDG